MATSDEDLEANLRRLERRFEKVSEHTYVVSLGAEQPPAVVRVAPPVVVIQVDVGPTPENDAKVEAALYRRLLELNATDLLHAAYGIEKGRILLDAALDLDSLDVRELEAVLADIDLAIAEHVPGLRDIVKKG